MAYSRTTDGLREQRIALDGDNPFSAGEWTTSGGMTFSVDGTTGRLVITSTSSTAVWRLARFTAAGEAPSDVKQLVQAEFMRVTGSPMSTPDIVPSAATDTGNDFAGGRISIGAATDDHRAYWNIGFSSGGSTPVSVAAKSLDTLYLVSSFIEKDQGAPTTFVEGYDFDSGERDDVTPATAVGGGATWPGLSYYGNGTSSGGATPVEIARFYVQNDKYLVVEDLPTGAVAKLRDSGGSVLAQATEGAGGAPSGSAWVDVTETDPADRYDLRLETSGGSLIDTVVAAADLWGGDVFEDVPALPDTPTIDETEAHAVSVRVESSTYVNSEGIEHQDTQWQVDVSAGDFSTPVVDQTDGAPTTGALLLGLSVSTGYKVRVRYQNTEDDWSNWSSAESFTTEASGAPNTPTVTVAAVGAISADLEGSHYFSPVSGEHVTSQWQVDLTAGDFSTPEWDSGETGIYLLAVTANGLSASTGYKARLRYRDEYGEWSSWSSAASFTTAATGTPSGAPNKPTISVDSAAATTIDVSSSAYSHSGGDDHESSQWQAATSSDFGADLVQDETSTTDLESFQFSDLDPSQTHYLRVRHKDVDGDWSEWSTAVSQATSALPSFPGLTAPVGGEAITAWPFSIEWAESVNVDLWYSTDFGGSWTAISTNESGGSYSWADPGLTDGRYVLRIAVTGTTDYQYGVFRVDALAIVTTQTADDLSSSTNWTNLWDNQQPGWAHVAAPQPTASYGMRMIPNPPMLSETGPGGPFPRWYTRWGGRFLTSALEPDQVELVTRVMVTTNAIGILGTWYRDAEFSYAGLGFAGVGTTPTYDKSVYSDAGQWGIALGLYTRDIWPLRNYAGREHAKGTAHLRIEGLQNGTPKTIYDASLGWRLNVQTPNDPHPYPPWYEIVARITTIRENPDGTRDVKIQVKIIGPDSEPSTSDWDVETSGTNLDLPCGWCGVAARNIASSSPTPGGILFSHLSVTPLTYGDCDPPPEFEPEIPEESCVPPALDVTIFGTDDETPILGTVAGGVVTEATFSTDPAHPRPYLKVWESDPEISIDPIKGSASISEMAVEIVDARDETLCTDPGIVTRMLPNSTGFSNLNGHRLLAREQLGDGNWRTVINGVIWGVELLENKVTFRLDVRDIRERERDNRIFVTPNYVDHDVTFPSVAGGLFSGLFAGPNTGTSLDGGITPTACVHPPGPVQDYGFIGTVFSTLDLVLIPATPAAPAASSAAATDELAGEYGQMAFYDGVTVGTLPDALVELGIPTELLDETGQLHALTWANFAVQWRPNGAGDDEWRTLNNLIVPASFEDRENENFWVDIDLSLPGHFQEIYNDFPIRCWWSNPSGNSDLTPPNSFFEARVVSLIEPTASTPFYWDGPGFQLLKDIWDGRYSRTDPHVRYDASRMAELIESGPRLRCIVTEVVEDGRKWIEDNILAPLGYVLTFNDDGELYPISTALPAVGESLPRLDSTNCRDATWAQPASDAVTVVTFTYIREFLFTHVRGTDLTLEEFIERYSIPRDTPWEELVIRNADEILVTTLRQRPITVSVLSEAALLLGSKAEIKYEPVTVRSYGQSQTGASVISGAPEFGTRLAMDRARETLDRFATGPQYIQASIFNTPSAVREAKGGNWIEIDLDWLPNLNEGDRGGVQLGLILTSQKERQLVRNVTLLHAGPGAVGLDPPVIG